MAPLATTADRGSASVVVNQRRRLTSNALVMVVTAVVLLPLAIAAVRVLLIDGGYQAFGDISVAEMRIRDIPMRPPLLGPYSRFGWNHPGPFLYYVLAVPYWLTGRQPAGLALGALLVNAAAIAGLVLLARRRAGIGGATWAALVAAVVVHGFGITQFIDSWNPAISVLPFLCFLLIAWSVAEGDMALLPWLVVVGSFVAQCHVGYVATVVGVGGVAIGFRILSARPRIGAVWESRRVRRSLAILVVLWFSPLLDVLLHRGGNIRRLIAYFGSDQDERVGFMTSLRVVSTELSAQAQWVRGFRRNPFSAEPVSAEIASPPIILMIFVVIAGIAIVMHRDRNRVASWLPSAIVPLVAVGVALVSIAAITGTAYDYLTLWASAVGMCVMVVGGILVTRYAKPAPIIGALLFTIVIAAAGTMSIKNSMSAIDFQDPSAPGAHLIADAARVIADQYVTEGVPMMATGFSGLGAGLASVTLLTDLERLDVPIAVRSNQGFIHGGHRVLTAGSRSVQLGVTLVDRLADVPAERSGREKIFEADELDAPQRSEFEATLRHVERLIKDERYDEIAALGTLPKTGMILTIYLLDTAPVDDADGRL